MSFASPIWLAMLALVPLAVVAAVLARRRANRYAVRFPAVSTARIAAGVGRSWTRYVPAAALLAALATLGVDQYLSKPYHPAELLTRISIELHRSTQATPAPGERLSASSWRLDRSSTRAQPAQALFKSPVID